MEVILGSDKVRAQFIFILTAATAPIPGALLGSAIADSYGGYKGKNQLTALKICCVFAICASVFAVWMCFVEDDLTFGFVMFMLLFFGSALTPACYGIIVSCVSKEYQSASSAFGQIFFNFGGFFLAPNISGYVIDSFQDEYRGLVWGYRLVLAWNIFTVAFLFGATFFSYLQYRKRELSE